ncbi:GNAT family N-acetyltransferase [Pedobacter sp. NJ-S-72]
MSWLKWLYPRQYKEKVLAGYWAVRSIAQKAKELGAKKIYLESNTILKPAINLYHKLGFVKVAGRITPYERCNIQMELKLSKD